jgi:hypothetical protein
LPGGIGWAVAIPHTEILAAGGQLTHCFSSRMVFQHLHCLERLRSPLAFGDTLRAKSKSDLGHGFSCNNHSTCRFAFCIMLSFSLDRIGRRALGSEKKPFLITLDWFFDRVNSTLLRIVVSPANAFHAKRGFLATRPNHVAADNLMSRFEATLNAVLRFPLLASSDRSAGFQPALPCRAPKQRRLRFPSLFWRAATLVTMIALLGSDPSLHRLWNANAQCSTSSESTITHELTRFRHELGDKLKISQRSNTTFRTGCN